MSILGKIAAVVVLLSPLFGIGFGIYVLTAESVCLSAFGLPVEIEGIERVVLAAFCCLPAVVFGHLFVVMWRERCSLDGGGADTHSGTKKELRES